MVLPKSNSKNKSSQDQTMTCLVLVIVIVVVIFVMVDYKKKKKINENFKSRCIKRNIDLFGGNIGSGKVRNARKCQNICRARKGCNYFTI